MSLLSRRLRARRVAVVLLFTAVAGLAAAYAHAGLKTDFLPLTLDTGENFEAHVAARNLHRDGLLRHSGLQDLSPEGGRPLLYIHNPNVGMYYVYVLFRLGIDDIHTQSGLAAVPFAFGLAYLYLFVRRAARSPLLAAVTLLTAASLYLLVTLWAFQLLRTFSWLATFGAAYHLHRAGRGRRLHLAAGALFLAVGFGIDYPFAAFAGVFLLLLRWFGVLRLRSTALLATFAFGLFLPFVLRQAQVASAVGLDFWWLDFRYTIARRVPVAGGLVSVPPPERLFEIYRERGVVLWPDMKMSIVTAFRHTFRPYKEALGLPLFVLLLLSTAGFLAIRRREFLSIARRAGRGPVVMLRTGMALHLAGYACFFSFPSYFAGFYGFSLMPLMVHWIVLLLSLTLYVLLVHAGRAVRIGSLPLPVGAAALAAFLLWRANQEIHNRRMLPPRPVPGHRELRELGGHSVVTTWIGSLPSSYTRAWAAPLDTGRFPIARSDLPFDPRRSYHRFQVADPGNPRYRVPDFLYVPGIRITWPELRTGECLRSRIATYADGFTDVDAAVRAMPWLPVHRRGKDFVIFDLRPFYARP